MNTEKLREAFRPIASGMPESVDQFQLALDAAYLAGQKVAEAQPPTPEQGDTHHWPQQGDTTWPAAPEQQAPQKMELAALMKALRENDLHYSYQSRLFDLLAASPAAPAPEAAKPERQAPEA